MSDQKQQNIVRFNEILSDLLSKHRDMDSPAIAELVAEVFRLGQATGPNASATITVIGLGYQAGVDKQVRTAVLAGRQP